MYDIFFVKRATRSSTLQQQRQRNVQKKCTARAKLLFLLIRPIDFFFCSCRRGFLALHVFIIIFFFKLSHKYINENFAFSPGKIYIVSEFKFRTYPGLS